MHRPVLDHWVFVVAVCAVGCESSADGGGTEGSSGAQTEGAPTSPGMSETTAVPTSSSASQGATSTSGGEESSSTEGALGSSGSSGLVDTETGGEQSCNLFDQNCPDGQKCMPWANDGSNSWNALKCTPIAPNPDGIDEACTAERSAVSGIDSCELGAMCWNVDPKTLAGACIPFCIGDDSNATCEDADRTCSISGASVLSLCLPNCDPLMPDCPDAQGCYPLNQNFTCAPDATGGAGGGYQDECEFLNSCQAGLSCIDGTAVPGCDAGGGCCTPYCDTTAPDCPDGAECQPYFNPGAAPKGVETVGFCGNPGA